MADATRGGRSRRFPPLRTILDAIAAVSLTIASGVVIWNYLSVEAVGESPAGRVMTLPTTPLAMDGVAVKGSSEAPVGIVEFSDFQCPFCGRFAREILPDLDRDYIQTGKIRFVLRHLPLDIHPAALPAAVAVECAGREGKFWELHDRLFRADPKTLTAETILTLTKASNVAASDFETCLASGVPDRVNQDRELARQLGVGSTPTFFAGRILPSGELDVVTGIPGALPLAEFRRKIDELLEPPSLGTKLRALFRR